VWGKRRRRAAGGGGRLRAMKPPTLRWAQPEDLPALQALEAGFPGDRLSPRQLRRHLDAGARLRVAVDDEGRLLGYALVLRRSGSRLARLYSLAVAAAARGRGLGRALLGDAERLARQAGATALRLEVRCDNAAAIALYRGAGYRDDGRRAAYYEDGTDALRMRRGLEP
jgi:[ribosomal protein S18]-alanine N-acetyltransferase